MAVKLLQVLVLGVIAAGGDDVPVTWVGTARASLPCLIPDAGRIPWRRPPPPLEGEDRPKTKHYSWRHDGVEIKRFSSNGTLEVSRRKGTTSADGLYQCSVRHPSGGYLLGYPINLKFASPDKQLSVLPEAARAALGRPFVLACNVTAGPPVTVTWLKDGKPLPDDNRHHAVGSQLLFTTIIQEDAGLYKCRAVYTYANRTRVSHARRLEVEVDSPLDSRLGFLDFPHETNVTVPRGGKLVLPCITLGDPKPVLIWEVSPPGRRTLELESTEQLLVLSDVDLDQAGLYVCKMEGHSDFYKTFNVTITTAVNITHAPRPKQAVRASTVRFNCTAAGHPPPALAWYKDGRPLSLSGRIGIVPAVDDKTQKQLLIRSVTSSDAGVYQCFARNAVSVASAWATLNVTGGEAAAPTAVECLPTGASEVRLRWTAVDDVVAYTVQYTAPGGNSLPGQPVINTEASINVKSPLTPYNFQVQAYIGTATDKTKATIVSDMSDTVTCQGQGVPITLSKVDDSAVLVSWRSFAVKHPGVLEWILQYKVANVSTEYNVTLDGSRHNYTLDVGSSGAVQVRVLGSRTRPWLRQSLALVPWTATSAAGHPLHDDDVKSVPVYVVMTSVYARNLTVQWPRERGRPGATYLVCTRPVGDNEHCFESDVNSATMTGLEPNTEHEVRVQVLLPGHTPAGDFSPPIHITTLREDDPIVKELSYTYINMSCVRVWWRSAPPDATVRYTTDWQLPFYQWHAADGANNTVLLSGVDPSKQLHVVVEGQEPFGNSPVLSIPPQIPEVKEVQYTYTDDGVEVRWVGGGPRLVMYSQNLTRPLDRWTTLNATGSSVQISGLDPSLHTFVMVSAPGPSERNHVLTVKPRPPPDHHGLYLGIGIAVGLLVVILVVVGAVCVWVKRKRNSPARSRRRRSSHDDTAEPEGAEMKNIGGRLANGGGSKDAGEPLLNGHVHITENPTQSKTPNGKVRPPYEVTFDVARFDDANETTADVTQETDLDTTVYGLLDTTPAYGLLDTSRHSAPNISREYFAKLPDDNMNSEIQSKVPTLSPNG